MKTIDIRDGYVFVYYDGQNDVNSLIADLSKMQGEPNFLDRFTLGVSGVWILREISRSAIVYRNVESNRFAETVAVNRGLPTLVTHDIEEAKRWLGVK